IRDFHVTGVQTCALPILPFAYSATRMWSLKTAPKAAVSRSFSEKRGVVVRVTGMDAAAVVTEPPWRGRTLIERAEPIPTIDRAHQLSQFPWPCSPQGGEAASVS